VTKDIGGQRFLFWRQRSGPKGKRGTPYVKGKIHGNLGIREVNRRREIQGRRWQNGS